MRRPTTVYRVAPFGFAERLERVHDQLDLAARLTLLSAPPAGGEARIGRMLVRFAPQSRHCKGAQRTLEANLT